MALDICWQRKIGFYPVYKSGCTARSNRKLAVQVPDICATDDVKGLEFLKKLKNEYCISQLILSATQDTWNAAHRAGYRNEDLVFWPSCIITADALKTFLAYIQTVYKPAYGYQLDTTLPHAVYIDEPHTSKPQSCNGNKNHLQELYDVAKSYKVEFVIGEYNSGWNNWWKEYASYADSVAYNSYWDQRDDWLYINTTYYGNGQPVSGHRAWVSAESDNAHYTELFHTASILSFRARLKTQKMLYICNSNS